MHRVLERRRKHGNAIRSIVSGSARTRKRPDLRPALGGVPDGMAIYKQSWWCAGGGLHTQFCNKILKKYLSFAIFRQDKLYYNRGKR